MDQIAPKTTGGVAADGPIVPISYGVASAATGERYVVLDALRGLAAVMVVLFHCEILSHVYPWMLVRHSEVFVDFFFVLSGFVIANAYAARLGSRADLARYAILRIGRIWPLHVVMLALFVAVEIVKAWYPSFGAGGDPAFTGSNAPGFIISNLLLVQTFGFDGALSWNTPSWSISAEVAAYALFALAVYFSRRRLIAALALGMIAALALLIADPEGMATTARLGAVRAIYGFSAGALLAIVGNVRTRAAVDAAEFAMATLAELAAVALLVLTTFVPEGDWRTFLSPAAFVIVVHVFAQEAGALSAALRTRPFVVLGGLSYAIYMIHMFINLRLLNVASLADRMLGTQWRLPVTGDGAKLDFGGAWAGDLATLALVATVIAVAMPAKRWIEDPGRAFARKLAARVGK